MGSQIEKDRFNLYSLLLYSEFVFEQSYNICYRRWDEWTTASILGNGDQPIIQKQSDANPKQVFQLTVFSILKT